MRGRNVPKGAKRILPLGTPGLWVSDVCGKVVDSAMASDNGLKGCQKRQNCLGSDVPAETFFLYY